MSRRRGYTVIELLGVLAIIGILVMISIPNVINALKTRTLETTARGVLVTFQTTKFRAVREKLPHRVRLVQDSGGIWSVLVEREDLPGTWAAPPGVFPYTLDSRIEVTANLPTDGVVFSQVGQVGNFATGQNSIVFRNPDLAKQDDLRTLNVFLGGSIQYVKSRSGS